jgi:alpha-L-rhamnosidase
MISFAQLKTHQLKMHQLKTKLISILVLLTSSALAADRVAPEITPVAPVRFEKRDTTYFVDFGEDAYGSLKIDLSTHEFGAELPPELKVRLGEKLDPSGAIDRKPGGFVSFHEGTMTLQADKHDYQLQLPPIKHPKGNMSEPIPGLGEIAPFRYAEIEGGSLPQLDKTSVNQLFVHAPFDDNASSFESSDETLNAVWHLCKHTMEATSAFGIYVDGDRERTPYEADAYINQLSFYACDLDPRVARCTFDYLLKHPTWPTEWSFHVPMIAAEDYMATGDIELARDNWDALKTKLLMDKARADGLLRAAAIVDWPMGYRDGYNGGKKLPGERYQLGPEYNTVVNAFYYHALQQMAMLARALQKENDANDFESKAKQVYESFNRVLFDKESGLYTDGEGSTHISLHANMFPLEFGLVPEPCKTKVADYVQSRGMACSVYGAQYLLESMFGAGRDDYAIQVMSAETEHSWWHMIELGSTITMEAWDSLSKQNLDWNHAWGAAPANIISRYVLGVRPLEPGYTKILIAPQPGALKWIRGKVPTPCGAVSVSWNRDTASLDIEVPPGATALVELPAPFGAGNDIIVDGKNVKANQRNATLTIDGISAGRHSIRFD